MARPSSHPFDLLVARFAEIFAERISAVLPAPSRGVVRDGARGPRRGRKLDMRCRYPGCKNQSKGPRFRFFCDEHRKLPRKEQDAALVKWAAKKG